MSHRSVLYELNIDVDSQQWGISCPLDQSLVGPVQYGWDRFKKNANSMTLGGGLLAGSPLPGTRRLIVCGYSKQWDGFYVSALGGAMYILHRVGINYIWLQGKSAQEIAIVIKLKAGEYSVEFVPLDVDQLWAGYADDSGRTWQGYYGLQKYLFDRFKNQFEEDGFRILATGPAARHTFEGAIGSNHIKHGELTVIDDWAGRGGLGSMMLQNHGVAAIVFGGDWQDPAMKEARELDEYFLDHFGQRAIATDLAVSQKYRYVPEFETGGTFGVNMHTVDDKLFSFNYKSIRASDEQRLNQHEFFIKNHYLKQFNEEIIQLKNFAHCGEPCAVACKKYNGDYKKDYEPYEALGPNCGIFDQRAAEKVNKFIDSMGWDSIQAGGLIAWIMELIAENIIQPQDFGLPLDRPLFAFQSDLSQFDLIADSEINANYAIEIAKMVLFSPEGWPFRLGIRFAAKYLDTKYSINSLDRAVYVAHGSTGCMVPNQYWTVGVFSPMPLMGKYFNHYGVEFIPPYDLGKKNVERFVYELYSENSGSCRFHRKWVEDIIDEIILSHFDLNFDYWADNFNLAKEIHNYQSGTSVFWESARVIEIVQGFLDKWVRDGLTSPDLLEWVDKFRTNPPEAAKAYWELIYRGISDTFSNGLSEPAHPNHGPITK